MTHQLIAGAMAKGRMKVESVFSSLESMEEFLGDYSECRDLMDVLPIYGGKSFFSRLSEAEGAMEWAKCREVYGYGGFGIFLIVYKVGDRVFFRKGHTSVRAGTSISQRIRES